MTIWPALAYRKEGHHTGLIQCDLGFVYWAWIVALGLHLAMDPLAAGPVTPP
jgi:hypothetical protein